MPPAIKTKAESLQDEIAKVNRQIAALDEHIAALSAEYAEIRLPQNYQGAATSAHLRAQEIAATLSREQATVDDLRNFKLPDLEKRLAFCLKTESAESDIKAARTAHAAAHAESQSIAVRRNQVAAKLTALQSQLASASEQTDAAAKAAAEVYAQAVASGDEKAQKTADAALKAAQDTVEATQRQRVVLDALQAETAKLDDLDAAAKERAKEARFQMGTAIEAKYAAQWDDVVEQLSLIGARIVAARSLAGTDAHYLFRKLNIDRLAPNAGSLTGRSIRRLVEEITLPEATEGVEHACQ
ncbi:hypothetical protein [Aromatoleum anaerobium]|uniref:Uncharacterized protein n=1 Tax=Aromatoleum anaerobium TaxID=182180 RepID=A0ABX1PQ21_9RHOO|nr:hypothetical protein [Aromatoleum anaerobium]MCK0508465.1 hypothetical protein [Aromatoleum anaerobium]